ncbi:MAG: amino acid adenylation domain-containing protein, partial [Candidatus Aminicenantes bacterium]
MDHQVKIRGFRIEPGEIETQLLKHDKIKDAVVVSRENPEGEKYLCAYILAKREGAFNRKHDISGLREFLFCSLPDYMIPAHFVSMENFPRAAAGKVDRKALPEPEITSSKEYIAPRDAREKALVEVWSEVLGIEKEKIGIDDYFFELGGQSLKAIRLISKIHKEFDVLVPLQEIFILPTIRGLSNYINKAKKSVYSSIELVEKKEYCPLSSAQKRLYILQQMEKNSISYNMSRVVVLEGEPERERMLEAFYRLIRRHESLRTSFIMKEGETVQRIHDEVEFEIECFRMEPRGSAINLCSPPSNLHAPCSFIGAPPGMLHANTIKDFIRPFDLSHVPLLRVGLIKIDAAKYILMVDMHHIVSDGISSGVLIKDFMTIYDGNELSPRHYTYKDFSEWQNSSGWRQAIKDQEEYWLRQFDGEIPVLNLTTDYTRPVVQSFEGNRVYFEIDKEETRKLNKLALEEDSTFFMILLAVYNILLSKISGQEDIIIGSPVVGRRHADLERVIGVFVNMLALRNYLSVEKTFQEFLGEVRERTLEALQNQEYQFEDLVEKVTANRDAARNPLFDVVFALQDLDTPVIKIPGLKLTPCEHETGISKFDLTVICEIVEEKLHFAVEYCIKLFKESTIQRFVGYFKKVLRSVLKNAGQKLSAIEIISDTEKRLLLYDFNDTKMDYPGDKTIHQLFEEQVERWPDNVALIGPKLQITNYKLQNTNYKKNGVLRTNFNDFGVGHLSYRELNEKANQLAHLLIQKGVGPDTIGGIIVERSVEMIIGLLGILKAGGAYLPIDPAYPQGRIRYMLADSRAKVLLAAPETEVKVKAEVGERFIEIIDISNFISSSTLTSHVNPANLAYIIYTSGSSGQPKGVLVRHKGFINLILCQREVFGQDHRTHMSQVASPGFDAMASEIWPCLSWGAALYIANNDVRIDPGKMKKWLITNCITISFQPTIIAERLLLEQWPEQGVELRVLFTAGDRLTRFPAHPYPFTLYNLYGPTEDTVWTTWAEVTINPTPGTFPSIGKPIKNHQVYILGPGFELQPLGVAGELCISGIGLAVGYLNRQELTAEKFCLRRPGGARHTPGPPCKNFLLEGTRGLAPLLYRTGDLARWLPNGHIDFLGRMDNQVKIRGFRIEPGEIENRLLMHKEIKEAIIVVKEDQGTRQRYLCGYIVSNTVLDGSQLRDYLSRDLPDYMIPLHFVQLERIPITANGKVDRKALPEPVIKTGKNVVPPRDEIEKKLVEIWCEVLGRDALHASRLHESIGIDDHFFELGGHSLKAAIVISMIHNVFNVRMTLAQLFTRPTIRALSQYIKEAEAVPMRGLSIEPAEKKEYYPLSPAQKRMYILQKSEKDKMIYNIPQVMVLEGELEKERLEEAFRRLIERHESFRISFEMVQGDPVQRVHHEVKFNIESFDLATEGTRGLAPLFREPATALIRSFIRPFDLSQPPLLRLGLVKTEHQQHLLIMDMHHIIFDGTSMKIFINELMALAEGRELPPLQVQYKDFSLWQNSQHWREKIKKQEQYWLKRFKGEIPLLKLPHDYPRPTTRSYEGNTLEFRIDMELTRALKQLATREEVTLFMVLLAVYNILLSKLSWCEDIVVGTTFAGRDQVELQPIIGMFVNTL